MVDRLCDLPTPIQNFSNLKDYMATIPYALGPIFKNLGGN